MIYLGAFKDKERAPIHVATKISPYIEALLVNFGMKEEMTSHFKSPEWKDEIA